MLEQMNMRYPKPRRRSYATSYNGTTPTIPTSIEIPAEIKNILNTIDGFIPDNIIAGVPTEYILLGAGIAITLLPLGKFKPIASLGAYAAIGLGGIKLVNPYLTAPAGSAFTTSPGDSQYYSTVTSGPSF